MVKRKDVVKFFRKNGFIVQANKGHDKLVHPDGRWTTLGRHTEIDDRLFETMKKQAGLK